MAEELDFDFRGFGGSDRQKESLKRIEGEPVNAGREAGNNSGKGKNAKSKRTDGRSAKGKKMKKSKHSDFPALFEPMTLRGLTVRNRIWLPPMDMYSVFERDGRPTQFHYQHYVSRALGGFGMVIAEATAVCPEGRISPFDTGLWEDEQIDAWRWIADGIKQAGAVAAIQLNHAGRKGSTGCSGLGYIANTVPAEDGGWPTVAPSEIAYGRYAMPRALSVDEIHGITWAFAAAARRAVEAGFQAIEIHAAHGYLISQFLDPLSNVRDRLGGRRLGSRPDRAAGPGTEGACRRSGGCVHRRHRLRRFRAGQPEIPGAVRSAGAGPCAGAGYCGGAYHQAQAGGAYRGEGRGGCRGDWPCRVEGSVLAVACRA